MGKWLAVGGVILVALAVFLWLQIKAPTQDATAAPVAAKAEVAPQAAPAVVDHAKPVDVAAEAKPDKPKKLDPQSDAFFYKFDELQPAQLTRAVVHCYTGGLNRVHRNQKLKLKFKDVIKDGNVSVTDVEVVESTLNNPVMERCMVDSVKAAVWHNDELPDWTQDDILVVRPERGMKKFTKENLDYEGSGPIGEAVVTPEQAKALEAERYKEHSPE